MNQACGPDDAALRRLVAADLNLLVVLLVLLRERSVTAAGARLHLGQPAVSAALRRLRRLLGDPLFLRRGRGIEPTARALALQPELEALLQRLDASTLAAPHFDPATSDRTLRLGLSDDNEIVFLPQLVRQLREVAPALRLVVRPISHADVAAALDGGEVELAMSVFGELPAWQRQETLYEQGYVCLWDPAQQRWPGPPSLDDYLGAAQAFVSFDGSLHGRIDQLLAERGLARDMRVAASRFSVLPHLVRDTPLVASLPALIGRVLAERHALGWAPLPLAIPPGRPSLAWHGRNDLDPAQVWLRDQVRRGVQEVVARFRAP
jgi:LysR family transcriptional regulator, mexEF-oprN operon transcriptional activator